MSKYILLLLLVGPVMGFSQRSKKIDKHVLISNSSHIIKVYTTAFNTDLKLSLTDSLKFTKAVQPIETEVSVIVNPLKSFQHFLGIGGAITDASAEVFSKLSKAKQDEFVNSVYSKEKGIGYTLARTNINSCDFSSASYTYISDGDKELKTFSIRHDERFRIPLIKRAIEASRGDLKIFASPWSPPAFMKDNNDMLHGGKLLAEYNRSWAMYFTKFIRAYAERGIPIWGITVQNEPLARQKWESCQFTAEEERDFIKFHLGPIMNKEGFGDKKIIVWDHNRDIMNQYTDVILSDPIAAKYVWGIGFHWYETWTGGAPMYSNVKIAHESYPQKNILFTEGCVERFDPTKFDYWPNAERYGSSMINDFNNGTVGWTDWNILLDQNGGPNHVQNFTFAPVHADLTTGKLIYTPSYYYLGHFSKFIRPGAKRVSATSTRSSLLCTSFLNQNGEMATIVMNQTDDAIQYKLYAGSKETTINIPKHAIQTVVY